MAETLDVEEVAVDTDEVLPIIAVPPHVHRIFFDPSTGAITGWEFTNTPCVRDGHAHLDVEHLHGVTHHTHRVDLASKQIVEMSEAEKATANLPKDYEVKSVIAAELTATDRTQGSDYKIKGQALSVADKSAWAEYRERLRRLSDLGGVISMLRAWPARPDGIDPVAALKRRASL